ncbi:MAG: SAM-dependent chlorinase/fluorinase, partial [Methanothrix sp.]|nr:SAM-dependent chlorinase/fluorinase [Methanothrix sp.]
IAHDIPPQDVLSGAFLLHSCVRFFPRGTIHIAVVDPGVGTDRLCIAVKCGGQVLLGPDNGLLMPAARSLGGPQAYSIALRSDASTTFHGRDILAPAAALLALGEEAEALGPMVDPVDLDFGEPSRTERGLQAKVIYVDRFGNLILNMRKIPESDLCLKGRRLRRARTYASGGRIEPLIIQGSHGFAEIAVNQGSAAEAFCLKAGDRIELEEI